MILYHIHIKYDKKEIQLQKVKKNLTKYKWRMNKYNYYGGRHFSGINPQILHENASKDLGLDKNCVIKGGFYTKPQLEALFSTLFQLTKIQK